MYLAVVRCGMEALTVKSFLLKEVKIFIVVTEKGKTMEINREQIINALECCTRGRKSKEDIPCLDCPYNECNLVGGTSERQVSGTCQGWLMKDALALIKEQDEQIFNLENRLKECENGYEGTLFLESCKLHDAEEKVKELTEENERLHASCTELIQCCTKLETLYKIECKRVDTIKADTVREFAERVDSCFCPDADYSGYDIKRVIEQIVNDMGE